MSPQFLEHLPVSRLPTITDLHLGLYHRGLLRGSGDGVCSSVSRFSVGVILQYLQHSDNVTSFTRATGPYYSPIYNSLPHPLNSRFRRISSTRDLTPDRFSTSFNTGRSSRYTRFGGLDSRLDDRSHTLPVSLPRPIPTSTPSSVQDFPTPWYDSSGLTEDSRRLTSPRDTHLPLGPTEGGRTRVVLRGLVKNSSEGYPRVGKGYHQGIVETTLRSVRVWRVVGHG